MPSRSRGCLGAHWGVSGVCAFGNAMSEEGPRRYHVGVAVPCPVAQGSVTGDYRQSLRALIGANAT